MLIHTAKWHDRLHRLLLAESAQTDIHILRHHQTPNLGDTPFQIIQGVRRDGHEDVGVVEILIIGKPLLQEVPGLDGTLNVVIVSVGVRCVLDPAAVDADLLSQFGLDAVFGHPGEVEVSVNTFPGIYQQACPPSGHAGVISVGGNNQIGVEDAIHHDVGAVR